MTKTKRIGNILVGIVLIGFAYLLMAEPNEGLPIVVGLVGLGMTMRGLGTLLYYFQMARFMVGGKLTLYRGIIFLDFGIFTASLVNHRGLFMILYIAGVNAFAGAVDLMRARESWKIHSPKWIEGALAGGVSVIFTIIVIVSGFLHRIDIALFVYGAGLAYTGLMKIIGAFRRTAIAYIP